MINTSRLATTRKTYERSLLAKANVNSIGYGWRHRGGERTDELCIVVGVTKKIDKSQMSIVDMLPSKIDDVTIDVVEVGNLSAFVTPTQRHRPIFPGISIGHKNITAGTFGCVVKKNGRRVILSNNHVLANSNDALPGDDILQPGQADGGTSADHVAVLEEFVPIMFGNGTVPPLPPIEPPACPIARFVVNTLNFGARLLKSKHRMAAYRMQSEEEQTNQVDAAIATPIVDMNDDIPEVGVPAGIAEADLGMQLQKFGRTTLYTQGEVLQTGVTVSVNYGFNRTAIFTDQIITGPMSQPGDSGSAVLDMNRNLVGLLFAGSDLVTILNPIKSVFSALDLTL